MGFFNIGKGQITKQKEEAYKLYKENPALAIKIAIGKEKIPDNTLAAVIYAIACDQVEKELKLATEGSPEYDNIFTLYMDLGNSHRNRKLSAKARQLKLRDSISMTQPIEIIKDIVNKRIEEIERTLPNGKTYEDFLDEEVKKMQMDIDEETSKITLEQLLEEDQKP